MDNKQEKCSICNGVGYIEQFIYNMGERSVDKLLCKCKKTTAEKPQ